MSTAAVYVLSLGEWFVEMNPNSACGSAFMILKHARHEVSLGGLISVGKSEIGVSVYSLASWCVDLG